MKPGGYIDDTIGHLSLLCWEIPIVGFFWGNSLIQIYVWLCMESFLCRSPCQDVVPHWDVALCQDVVLRQDIVPHWDVVLCCLCVHLVGNVVTDMFLSHRPSWSLPPCGYCTTWWVAGYDWDTNKRWVLLLSIGSSNPDTYDCYHD